MTAYGRTCTSGLMVCVDQVLLSQTIFNHWQHIVMSNKIQLSKYHDADLIGLKYSDLEKGLELSFKLMNGIESIILFPGCQFYRIDGMWKQNVVYRIRSTLTESINHNEILKILYSMVRNDNQMPSLPTSQIDFWMDSIFSSDLILSIVEPSTGAEFMVVSRTMKEVMSHD